MPKAAAAIPDILVRPPWARGLAPRSAPNLRLPALPFDAAIGWSDSEREGWLAQLATDQREWLRETLDRLALSPSLLHKPGSDAARRRAVEKGIDASYQSVALGVLPFFPPFLAALIAELLPPRRWHVDPDAVALLLAKDGLDALDFLLRLGRVHPAAVLSGARCVRSPRLAPLAARGLSNRLARGPAQRWLFEHWQAAIAGLLPDALGPAGASQRDAESTLRWLAAQGHGPAIAQGAQALGGAAREATRALLEHDGSLSFVQPMPALPPYAAKLPAVLLSNGARLDPRAMKHLVQMLAISTLEDSYVGVGVTRASAEPHSLSTFSWALFEAWREAGCSSKEVWAYQQLAFFGDDEAARKLARYIRAWPGKLKPPVISFCTSQGIDVLARMDADVALLELARIAESSKPKLELRAKERLALLAEQRGLSEEQIADRVVPTLGFDASGTRTLEAGYALTLDDELGVLLRDPEGIHHAAPPKGANKNVTAAFKAAKADTRAVVDRERRRLELAMCSARRWSEAELCRWLLAHPLLRRLCRRVVFGAYGPQGLRGALYVDDQGELRDERGAVARLPSDLRIGVAHPLELGSHRSAVLAKQLAPMHPLFPQLDRETFALRDEEGAATALTRWQGQSCGVGALRGLERHGWRSVRQDSSVAAFEKDLTYEAMEAGAPRPSKASCRLRIRPGYPIAVPSLAAQQQLGPLELSDGAGRPLPYRVLSAVVASELVRDVTLAFET